jgi:hypothetical protein
MQERTTERMGRTAGARTARDIPLLDTDGQLRTALLNEDPDYG